MNSRCLHGSNCCCEDCYEARADAQQITVDDTRAKAKLKLEQSLHSEMIKDGEAVVSQVEEALQVMTITQVEAFCNWLSQMPPTEIAKVFPHLSSEKIGQGLDKYRKTQNWLQLLRQT